MDTNQPQPATPEIAAFNRQMEAKLPQHEAFYRQHRRAIAQMLRQLGRAWGGEEQRQNNPETTVKKRYGLGYTAPALTYAMPEGRAELNHASLSVHFWTGGTGTIHKAADGRGRVPEPPEDAGTQTRIMVALMPESAAFVVNLRHQATSIEALKTLLVQLWKDDAFGLRRG